MKALVFMRVSGGLPYYNTSLYSSNYSSGFHIYKNLLALVIVILLSVKQGDLYYVLNCNERYVIFFGVAFGITAGRGVDG